MKPPIHTAFIKDRRQKLVRVTEFTGLRPCFKKDIIHGFFGWLFLELAKGNAVKLPNVGTITHRWRAKRSGAPDMWILKLKTTPEMKRKMVELAAVSPWEYVEPPKTQVKGDCKMRGKLLAVRERQKAIRKQLMEKIAHEASNT